MIPLEGYAPDADPTIPGIFTNCDNVIPTVNGFAGAPGPLATLLPALASTCQGSAVATKLDATNRVFAGSGTKLYEAAASSWTDRTRASGGDYSPASDVRWRFAQYGDVSLAVNKADTLQSSSSGAFADVTGAPKASIVETALNFVFLFDTNEATYSDSTNRWWCSALGDYTDWTPDVATQCATGILTGSPGKVRAGKRFGEGIVAYKDKAMYIGVYVGPPNIWEFRQIPGEVGALSQEAVVNIGTSEDPRHIFMAQDDFYVFDGARPVPIGDARIRETVFQEVSRKYQYLAAALHNRFKSIVYFFYPSSDSVTLDKCVVYNYRTNKWGRDNRNIQVPVDYVTADTTYADVGTLFTTYGDMPNTSYGTAFGNSGSEVPAVFDTTNTIQTLVGPSVTSSITTGDYGDDNLHMLVNRFRLRYSRNPTSATMTNYYKHSSGDALTTGVTTAQSNGRFDVLRSARWHRFRVDFVGDWEASAMQPAMKPDGNE